MSVELQEQRVRYLGNGTARTFAFPFTIEEPEQVQVVQADAKGSESTLALTQDYTVALNSDGTGSVTLTRALPTGYVLALVSNIEIDQERAFYNNTPYYQEQIEGGLDKLTRICQQLEEKQERSVTVPATSSLQAEELVADLFQARVDAQSSATAAAVSQQAASDSAEAARTHEAQTAELLVQTEQTVAQAKASIEAQREASVQSVLTQQEASVQSVLTQQESSVQQVLAQQESSVQQVQDQEAASLALIEAEVAEAQASARAAEQSRVAAFASEKAAAESAAKAENYAQEAFPDQTGAEGQSLVSVGGKAAWWPMAEDIVAAAEAAASGSEGESGDVTLDSLLASVTQLEGSSLRKTDVKAYIVETWSSGTEWYRKWSDGWIEQGGWVNGLSAWGFQTVTLHKEMADTNYSVKKLWAVTGQIGTASYDATAAVYSRNEMTTISFRTYSGVWSGFFWEVEGRAK